LTERNNSDGVPHDSRRRASALALAALTDGGTPLSLSALAIAPSRSVWCPRNSDGFAGLRASSAVAVGSRCPCRCPCRPVEKARWILLDDWSRVGVGSVLHGELSLRARQREGSMPLGLGDHGPPAARMSHGAVVSWGGGCSPGFLIVAATSRMTVRGKRKSTLPQRPQGRSDILRKVGFVSPLRVKCIRRKRPDPFSA